jgi:hypothetical protein
MSTMPRRAGDVRTGCRTAAAVALTVSLIGALAALPTAPASATTTPSPSIEIPNSDLGSIAQTLPVKDLGLTDLELGQLLSGIEGLQGLSGEIEPVVSSLLNSNPNATVGQLADSVLGNGAIGTVLNTLHLGLSPEQILASLSPGQTSTLLDNLLSTLNGDQVSTLLSGLSGKLSGGQLESLQSVLAPVTSMLSGGELAKLQENLTTLLSGLSSGKLGTVLSALEGSASGAQLTQLETLIGKLGSLSPTELQTKLEALLKGLSGTQLSGLLSTLLGKLEPLEPSAVQTAVTDLLGNLPLSPTNAGSLAGQLNTSVEKLSSNAGVPLTSATPALVSTLGKEGPVLSVMEGVHGLKLGLLKPEGSGGSPGGNGGSGGNGSNGSNGSNSERTENTSQDGTGGLNSNSGASSTLPAQTVTIVLPHTAVTSSTAKAATKAKIKIISDKVKGNVATLVLQVPAAGKVSVSGAHVTKVTRTVGKAERVTIKVKLTRAGVASLKRHRKLLRVNLKATFDPKSGPASSATASTRFV